jgi:hypothetical protein
MNCDKLSSLNNEQIAMTPNRLLLKRYFRQGVSKGIVARISPSLFETQSTDGGARFADIFVQDGRSNDLSIETRIALYGNDS